MSDLPNFVTVRLRVASFCSGERGSLQALITRHRRVLAGLETHQVLDFIVPKRLASFSGIEPIQALIFLVCLVQTMAILLAAVLYRRSRSRSTTTTSEEEEDLGESDALVSRDEGVNGNGGDQEMLERRPLDTDDGFDTVSLNNNVTPPP